jgi:hypothetical protein
MKVKVKVNNCRKLATGDVSVHLHAVCKEELLLAITEITKHDNVKTRLCQERRKKSGYSGKSGRQVAIVRIFGRSFTSGK